jgi:hypothetical protein
VARNADDARPPAARALPALNPNHPNQRMPPPSITIGTLCGVKAPPGYPFRFPTYSAAAKAAAPALMCTTVPPAKSRAPIPAGPRNPPPHTQCASGE